jgi:hypothetical protein
MWPVAVGQIHTRRPGRWDGQRADAVKRLGVAYGLSPSGQVSKSLPGRILAMLATCR